MKKKPRILSPAQHRAWALFVLEGAIKNISLLSIAEESQRLQQTAIVSHLQSFCSDLRNNPISR